MPGSYHQGPASFESQEGWAVEFLGHGRGARYVDGKHTLLFDTEFLVGGAGRRLGVWRRRICNWDPPSQMTAIGDAEAKDIESRLFKALRAMGHEPVYVD